MSAVNTLKDTLFEMVGGLAVPGVEGPWVVMLADSDGMLLASWEAPGNKISPEAFGGFVQIINYVNNTFKSAAVGFTKLDDITITTPFTHMIVKPIASGACFIFVSAPKSVPLGMIRMSLTNFAPKFELAMPGHESIFEKDRVGETVVL